jgi:prepilin-type N-terminal cleavage/methylation domain-containing protein
MISLKRKESGFTIVELLIVIVVIGILAALVITTFSGIQQKARNSERQTDINAVHSQVEAYYAQNGKYPGLTDLQTGSFISAQLKGLDQAALKDPKGTSLNIAAAADNDQYGYTTTPSTCGTGTGDAECTGYTLTANLEPSGTYTKSSLNN